jgi:hypothetical protein
LGGYLEMDIHRALKLQAAETDSNVSVLINNALRDALREDREDLAEFDARAEESTISFEKIVKTLKLDGQLSN